MFATIRSLVPILVLIFVVSTMLHVGLTQPPSRILNTLKNWRFVVKMVVANFIAAPILMIVILRFTTFGSALDAGLLVFGLCAGAPFLIKLTQTAEHDLAVGAATMLLLMVLTVLYVPLVLPRILEGLAVDTWALTKTLLLQLILPIVAGMFVAEFAAGVAERARAPVARIANIALYAVIAATLIGYWPNTRGILGTGAIFAGLAFVAGAFGIGYLAGRGADHLEDIGGLGTAQRNTAAALIIATQNFEHPDVLVIVTIVNTLGILLLLMVARALSRDNPPRIVNV